MKTVAQRELRNRISEILRQVERGKSLRITVNGRPVADLVPVGGGPGDGRPRRFVPRDEVLKLIARAPLDRKFAEDVERAAGATIEEIDGE